MGCGCSTLGNKENNRPKNVEISWCSISHRIFPCIILLAPPCRLRCWNAGHVPRPKAACLQSQELSSEHSGTATDSDFDCFLSSLHGTISSDGAVGSLTVDAQRPSASETAATPTLPCLISCKRKPASPRSVRRNLSVSAAGPSSVGRSGAVRCKITNETPTYLRRLHLSPDQAVALLPSLAGVVLPLDTSPGHRARARARFKDVRIGVDFANE